MEMELAVLKRAVNDLPWWLPVFDSGRRRAVSGLKSAGAVVSNLGARQRAAGALAVSAQNRHSTWEAEGLGYFILEWSRSGLMGRQYPWAWGFLMVWASKPSPPYLGRQRPG